MVQTVSTHVGNRAANRTALILGATGGVGGAIAARLMREGWQVRALCRNADAARSGWRHGCPAPQFVTGDAMDGASSFARPRWEMASRPSSMPSTHRVIETGRRLCCR